MDTLKKKRGAPFKAVKADITVKFMATAEFNEKLVSLADQMGVTRSDVIRLAVLQMTGATK